MRHERRLPHNLVSILQIKNVIWKKTRNKTLNIFEASNRFSLRFHQYDRKVSGHLIPVTDDLENVGQGQNLFLKNTHF